MRSCHQCLIASKLEDNTEFCDSLSWLKYHTPDQTVQVSAQDSPELKQSALGHPSLLKNETKAIATNPPMKCNDNNNTIKEETDQHVLQLLNPAT